MNGGSRLERFATVGSLLSVALIAILIALHDGASPVPSAIIIVGVGLAAYGISAMWGKSWRG